MHAQASFPPVSAAPEGVEDPAPAATPAARSADATRPTPESWTAVFLAPAAVEEVDLRAEAARFATGAGLAALYGLALGARDGGAALLRHALGVPAALLAVAGLGVPALFIALALFDAPLDPSRVAAAAARGSASAGLLLAGLAPAAALYVVSSEDGSAAALAGAFGLFVGGLAGLVRLLRELGRSAGWGSGSARVGTGLAFAVFALFATALAARVWWSTLPLLGGAS